MHFNNDLNKYIINNINNDYKANLSDLKVNKQRLIEKYNKKPYFIDEQKGLDLTNNLLKLSNEHIEKNLITKEKEK